MESLNPRSLSADNVPRPEYPRPQFVRQHWMNLNGKWEFAFDDGDQGSIDGWHDGRTLEGEITVPFAYQYALSGIDDKSIHEIVWYARSFEVSSEWLEQNLLLHFGAVDYRATLWINGQEVGHNRGGHVPFSFDISPYVKEGENRLTLRVEDKQDPHQPRGKQSSSGLPKGIDYYCTTGIWQTVWLEPVPPLRIQELRITPHFARSMFEVTVYLHAPATGWCVEVEIRDGDSVVAQGEAVSSRAAVRLALQIPDTKPWTPDNPHLYHFTIRLKDDTTILDEVESYAGMRSVELHDGRIVLNGEPVYLAMVLDQGYWPESGMTAPTDEALRADVEWIKRFGFNGVRKHQKIEDPRWLTWCDRLGLLVWGEMPNARSWSAEAEENLLAEWERAVRRDYNHPCVITWVPINESMGFPGLCEHPGQIAFLERIVAETRHWDITRPVVDNDGWEHTDVTDIMAIHDYSHTAEALKQHWTDRLQDGPLPTRIWTGSRAFFVKGARYHGQPIVLSEVGGFLNEPNLPPEQRDRLYNIYASFQTSEELLAKYDDLMQGIAEMPFVAGFCYTQLTDIEQEINGLLTYDRHPKVVPEKIAEMHRRLLSRVQT